MSYAPHDKYFIRDTTMEDAFALKLRDIDLLECRAVDPDIAEDLIIEHGRLISNVCRALIRKEDDKPVVIYGVTPSYIEGWGHPWLLASDEIYQCRLAFLRHCKKELENLWQSYSCLHNFTHVDNDLAQAWLRWLGFEFIPKQVQFNGHAFVEFMKVRPHV